MDKMIKKGFGYLTSRHNSFHSRPIDEGSFDGLCTNVGPVDTVLESIIIHHRHIVDVGHSERDDVVVIGVINVHSSDFNLTSIEQKLTELWRRKRRDNLNHIIIKSTSTSQ